ncbi:hypothetical protein Glove_9g260 [Diversispora epigaea]|uniref:Galactose oxidase n=1 Tax=Diversispora epigaea TaxID=1348612 RepID=A0A397JX57_9GLOM|nr:hypothetical protein Glove_9g260 [Diversispora epigaea]
MPRTLSAKYIIAYHNGLLINNQLLILGGIKTTVTETQYSVAFEVFYLDLSTSFNTTNLTWNLIPEGNLPIYSWFSSANVGLGNSTIFLIGGYIMNKDSLSYDYSKKVHTYDYPTKKWDTPSTFGDIPPRQLIKGVIDNSGIIYIFGGFNSTNVDQSGYSGTFYNDIIILNTVTMSWTSLSIVENLPLPRGGYSVNLLPNGLIVYIGGLKNSVNTGNTTKYTPVDINNINVFDTKKYEWSEVNAVGETIDSRSFHTSVLTPDGYIIMLGGCVMKGEFANISFVSPNFALLNTNKSPFEWSIPESSKNNSPPPLHGHEANLYYNYMIITFGYLVGNNTWLNSTYNENAYLYDITNNKWVTSFDPPVIDTPIKEKSSSKTLAIGLGIGGGAVVILIIIAIIFCNRKRKVIRIPGSI